MAQTQESSASADDAVQVWWTRTRAHDPRLAEALYPLLDGAERAQFAKFHFDRDRWIYLVAHALTRVALSTRAPVEPRDWSFEAGRYGRPEIAHPAGTRLRFNLSHTRGLVACIVARDIDCGVDVEQIGAVDDVATIARRMFSTAEIDELNRHEGRAYEQRFTEYWTLKEAYIKARGLGLQLDTKSFTLELEPGGPPRIRGAGEASPEEWCFGVQCPTEEHGLAWALHSGAADLVPDVREFTLPRLLAAGEVKNQ